MSCLGQRLYLVVYLKRLYRKVILEDILPKALDFPMTFKCKADTQQCDGVTFAKNK